MENPNLKQHIEFFKNSRKWVPNYVLEKESKTIAALQPNCKFQTKTNCIIKYLKNNIVITVMSYNVLADSYLGFVDYGVVDEAVLLWEYRRRLIQ